MTAALRGGVAGSVEVHEVMRSLRLSSSAVYRRIESGVIPAKKMHVRPKCAEPCRCPYRIPKAWLEAEIERTTAA